MFRLCVLAEKHTNPRFSLEKNLECKSKLAKRRAVTFQNGLPCYELKVFISTKTISFVLTKRFPK